MSKGKWAVVMAVIVLLGAVLLVGCEKGERNNFSHITYQGEPLVTFEADPRFRAEGCRSFVILTGGGGSHPITERRLGWMLAWALEAMGYEEAATPAEADLVLSLVFSNEYRTSYVPPTTVTVPWRERGKWVNSDSTIQTPYGTATGHTSTWVPGGTTYIPVTRPGRTVGCYYPALSISAYDRVALAASPNDIGKALVWTGTIVHSSNAGDGILSGQFLLGRLLSEHPVLPRKTPARGSVGVGLVMLTADGVNAYPTVAAVIKGSAAEKAGLRQWDMVLEVNGQATANVTQPQFADMLGPATGRLKRLLVKRPEGEVTIQLTVPGSA
jgi:membrane-associated protease RseP (regulator of RpoE activity)